MLAGGLTMTEISLQIKAVGRFFHKSSGGYTSTFFLNSQPASPNFTLSADTVALSGFVTFRYLYSHNRIQGVVFESIRSKTVVSEYLLNVGTSESSPDEVFEPTFQLEKLGVLVFTSNNGSVLAIPTRVSSRLLVPAEED